jgi:primosomal protein N'
MPIQITVFISSKMQELKEEREILYKLLPRLGDSLVEIKPFLFEESTHATSKSSREVFLKELQKSELYIGVFWNKYGEWTIDEFDHATKWDIERHLYIKNVDSAERESKLSERIEKYTDVEYGIISKWFSDSKKELPRTVKKAIHDWLRRYFIEGAGSPRPRLLKNKKIFLVNFPSFNYEYIIGRKHLIEEIKSKLKEKKARVLLQGLGGTGKTTIALAIAHDFLKKGLVVWLRIGNENTDTILGLIADKLGEKRLFQESTTERKYETFAQILSEAKIKLLIFDDVWNGTTFWHTR